MINYIFESASNKIESSSGFNLSLRLEILRVSRTIVERSNLGQVGLFIFRLDFGVENVGFYERFAEKFLTQGPDRVAILGVGPKLYPALLASYFL